MRSPFLMESTNTSTTYTLPSPPPLQMIPSNFGNNELIENNNENMEIPMFAETVVPPLELLTENKTDVEERKEQTMENVHEEVVESGDIIPNTSEIQNNNNITNNIIDNGNNNNDNSNTTTTNNNATNNNRNNIAIQLSSTGRLLESESEWQLRPKVTFDNLNRMIFRPLRMKCTHCSEAYTKTHDLYAHIRTHQDHTKCPHCQKILTCMATFVYHVRTHTAEKPYYCPVANCAFQNAVKYNLKVHLACMRHGGKDNLKKYAKILDLDVCEKSLRKRKDNSVHELGSRRSRKRRKLNNIKIKNNNNNNINDYSDFNINNTNNINEYDQFATKLLFSLSGMPPMFDHPINPIIDWNTIISPQNEINIKSENQINNINIKNENNINIKHEPQQQQYYDPSLYNYYMNMNMNMNANINTNTNMASLSTSSICDPTEHIPQVKLENNINTNINDESILFPKPELITNDLYVNTAIPSYINDINYFHYPQPYYFNYDNTVLYSNHPSNNQINSQINDTNNNEQNDSDNKNNIDVPPLPIPYQNGFESQ